MKTKYRLITHGMAQEPCKFLQFMDSKGKWRHVPSLNQISENSPDWNEESCPETIDGMHYESARIFEGTPIRYESHLRSFVQKEPNIEKYFEKLRNEKQKCIAQAVEKKEGYIEYL